VGRCAGAAVGISVKPIGKRVGAYRSGTPLSTYAPSVAGSDVSGHADGDSQFRAHRSDAAYITPSLLLLGWRR
jgi:hypothetical protein